MYQELQVSANKNFDKRRNVKFVLYSCPELKLKLKIQYQNSVQSILNACMNPRNTVSSISEIISKLSSCPLKVLLLVSLVTFLSQHTSRQSTVRNRLPKLGILFKRKSFTTKSGKTYEERTGDGQTNYFETSICPNAAQRL